MPALGFSSDGTTFVIATSPGLAIYPREDEGQRSGPPDTCTLSGTPVTCGPTGLPSVTNKSTAQGPEAYLIAEYSWWLMDAVISMTSVQIDLICAYLVESWFFRMTPMSKHPLQTLRYVSRTPG
jgi:hypothetical protein